MSLSRPKRKGKSGPAGRRRTARKRRHARILKKLRGTSQRPRLVVRRTLKHVEAQLVDDDQGVCVTGVSTRAKDVQAKLEADRGKSAQSRLAGKLMAEKARARGVTQVVFDRGGCRYHGRVKAFAEGAREGGLKF
ncbi:MAG: 50S ribosomal protein L18 [Gemmatimonadota bacterium]